MRKTPPFKYIRFLHYFLKSGKYKKYEKRYQGYSKSTKYNSHSMSHTDHSYHHPKVSDYQLGVDSYHYDIENNRQIKRFPVHFMQLVNHIIGNRLNEIIDYMNGYQDAKNNHHS